MGCSSIEKNENFLSSEGIQKERTNSNIKISELYEWEEAKIKKTTCFPNFNNVSIVQNDTYVFFCQDGNKIVRINKSNKEKKCILQLDAHANEQIGGHLCISDDKLFVEYAGDIYSVDFEGKDVTRIISSNKLKKRVADLLGGDVDDLDAISSLAYYKNNLYFYSGLNILRINLKTKELEKIACSVLDACFYDNALYYIDTGKTVIYKVDLLTYKKKRILGKNESVTLENSEKLKYYEEILVVDNQLYYVQKQNGTSPVLYKYCQDEEAQKIYKFDVESWCFLSIDSDTSRVLCESFCDSQKIKKKLMIYDIKSSVESVIEMPIDYETFEFLFEDMVFYSRYIEDDKYLLCLKLEEG